MTDSPTSKEIVAAWITHVWGERCPDFDPNCHTCANWTAFDEADNWASHGPPAVPDLPEPPSEEMIIRAIAFYERCPDGQYDVDVVVPALRQLLERRTECSG